MKRITFCDDCTTRPVCQRRAICIEADIARDTRGDNLSSPRLSRPEMTDEEIRLHWADHGGWSHELPWAFVRALLAALSSQSEAR